MNAKLVQDHSHDRKKLADIVPLDAPLSLTVLASNICNLKCSYCVHGVGASWLPDIQRSGYFFKLDTAKKMVDGLKQGIENGAPKLKRITYAGYGEPLLNPELAEIIAYTKENQVTEQVVVVSNAVALTHELSGKLIDAGLDLFRVSVQGITAESYKQQSGVSVNIEKLSENLRRYYDRKGGAENKEQLVYIKIMNEQLKNEQEREIFLKLFGDSCDEMAFESLAPVLSNATENDKENYTKGVNNETVSYENICPLPFYSLHVVSNGDISSCCYYDHSATFGNVNDQTIYDVWNGDRYKSFLREMLSDAKSNVAVCGGCKAYAYTMRKEDSLDVACDKLCKWVGV